MEITVNGETIARSLFEQEKERLHMDPEAPPYDELDTVVRDTLVARTLIRQAAVEKNLPIPEKDITGALDDLIEDAGSREHFFRRYGISEDQEHLVKEEIKVTLQVEKLVQEIGGEAPEPAEEEIAAFYEEHKDKLIQPEETEAMHIVMSVHCEHEARDVYKEMRQIRTDLLAGADFEQMAAMHSADKENGAKLGRFSQGSMVPEFEAIAFSMSPGELSPIFQTQFGYHIVKVTGRVVERQLTLEEARSRIVEALLHRKKNELIEGWVENRKQTAEITVGDS
jgi:foldase protein PrsA